MTVILRPGFLRLRVLTRNTNLPPVYAFYPINGASATPRCDCEKSQANVSGGLTPIYQHFSYALEISKIVISHHFLLMGWEFNLTLLIPLDYFPFVKIGTQSALFLVHGSMVLSYSAGAAF